MLFGKKKKESVEIKSKLNVSSETLKKLQEETEKEEKEKEKELKTKIAKLALVADFDNDSDDVIDKYAERIEALHEIKNDSETSKELVEALHQVISDLEFAKIRALGNLNSKAKGRTRYKPENEGQNKAELFRSKAKFYPVKEIYRGKLQVTIRALNISDLYGFSSDNFSSLFSKMEIPTERIPYKELSEKYLLHFEDKESAITWVNTNVISDNIDKDYLRIKDTEILK